jgi:hypothetical protein
MPVLPHLTPLFSVDKAAWTPLTADPSGGTATYGTKVYIPAVESVSVDPDVLYKELFGDNAIAATAAKPRSVKAKVNFGKIDLDLLKNLLGGLVTDAGTTPNQTSTLDISRTSAASYGKLECQVLGVELPTVAAGGDVHFVWWKAKLNSLTIGTTAEDYGKPTMSVTGIYLLANDKMFSVVENETAVAL